MERLNDIEKQQMKEFIIEQGFGDKKKGWAWKKGLVAAVAVVMIGIPIFGATFPALAEQIVQYIPVVRGVFGNVEVHQQERLVGLDNWATGIGQSLTFDGVTLTLAEVVFDGQIIQISYEVESDRALGERFLISPSYIELIVDGTSILFVDEDYLAEHTWLSEISWSSSVSEYNYIGVFEFGAGAVPRDADEIEVLFHVSEIRRSIFDGNYTIAEGEWNFNFELAAISVEMVEVNQTVSTDNFQATIYELALSPVTTRFYFSTLVPRTAANGTYTASIDWRIRDDLGNFYQWDTSAATSDGRFSEGWHAVEGIAEGARYLIITPIGVITEWETMGIDSISSIGSEIIELEPITIELP